ncbi:hypothetical protein BJ742DRAFT_327103 [Cladochytrium replicatum]|nr:hypothetical protein BJ742DRAFT_327103 [Cladochytrium replicatum]
MPTQAQKPASLVKSRTLEMLQRWLESTSETQCLVQAPPTPPASVTTPLFSDLFSDLGSPTSLDESSVLPGNLFSSVGLEEPYSFGTALALGVQQTPLPSTPARTRQTAEMSCQTDLTMSDFVGFPVYLGSTSRYSTMSRSNSPTQRSTPDNTDELSDDDESGPDFAACKSPDEILALILKTRQNRHDQLYHCPSCDKAFSRRFNLKTHYAGTHCNVRNFCCSCCDRAFSRRYDLQRHEKLVHKLDDGAGSVSSGGPVHGSARPKRSL